ncbi:MAG: hypothetical protein F6K04_02330 [Leptolyngbya sp. SIO4C5]|nr:hypothetical protein [Leptolyngbya sp. SIO4C5]
MQTTHIIQVVAKTYKDPALTACICRLLNTPFAESEFDTFFQQFMELSTLHMLEAMLGRRRIKIRALPQGCKPFYKAQGVLLSDLLSLVSNAFTFNNLGYKHPAIWFCEILLEREVYGCIWSEGSEGTVKTKTDLVNRTANENRQLANYQNPFTPSKRATWQLFELVIPIAEGNGRFNSQIYKPFVKSRKAALTESRKVKAFCATEGRPKEMRQGRKSNLKKSWR